MGTCGLLLFLTAVVVGSAQLVSAQVGYPGYPGYNQFYGVSGHATECESDSDCRSAGYRCQFAPVSGKSYCTPSQYQYPYSSYYGYGGYPYDYYGYYGYGGYPYYNYYDYYGSGYYGYNYPYYNYYGSYPYYGYGYGYGYYPYYGHPYVGYTGEGTAEPRQGPPPTLTPEQLEEAKAKHEEMRKKAEEFWRNRQGKEQLKPGESLEDHVVPMGGEWLPPPPPPPQGEQGNQGNQEERRRWMPPRVPRGRRPATEEQVNDDGVAVN
ncbi:prisilkin-39-like isoform X1 [Branchiostoma floridae]|uniref:Prisilkin-39-like isoform X1 n=1 Tax=Branchiostoma floridae TaxID=7739 RepID=A0A9J7LS39_BRAFL|nr:prisilkin-39-like isoform X1 [Branchiostoma floridae]XP_035687537.1 prisilkin-39-like isoform X1 [Branchiostoma floridae]